MKKYMVIFLALVFFIFIQSKYGLCNADFNIWRNFVKSLRNSEITKEEIRPYNEDLREPMYQFLAILRKNAVWEEWEKPEEIRRVNDKLQILIPLAFGEADSVLYLFTLTLENDNWYFQHMENITIRLDKIDSIPISNFPDIPDEKKYWIMEEDRWSNIVRLYNFLLKEKGKEFALNWMKDGTGYFLEAKTWVPMLSPEKAFIMYVCWEQSIIRGNNVTLQKLEDNEAIIQIVSQFFKLYNISAHLKTQIAFEDYRQLFETIWNDRAEKAGWNLSIKYDNENVQFIFYR
jgi:hypothetical protein